MHRGFRDELLEEERRFGMSRVNAETNDAFEGARAGAVNKMKFGTSTCAVDQMLGWGVCVLRVKVRKISLRMSNRIYPREKIERLIIKV